MLRDTRRTGSTSNWVRSVTNAGQQRLSWEARSCAVYQGISSCTCPTAWFFILCHMNTVHNHISIFTKIHFVFFFPLTFPLGIKTKFILRCFRENCGKRLLVSSYVLLRPHRSSTHLPFDGFSSNVVFIFPKSTEKIQVLLKSDKNNGYFTWGRVYIYDNTLCHSFLLIMRNVSGKSCRKK